MSELVHDEPTVMYPYNGIRLGNERKMVLRHTTAWIIFHQHPVERKKSDTKKNIL